MATMERAGRVKDFVEIDGDGTFKMESCGLWDGGIWNRLRSFRGGYQTSKGSTLAEAHLRSAEEHFSYLAQE